MRIRGYPRYYDIIKAKQRDCLKKEDEVKGIKY